MLRAFGVVLTTDVEYVDLGEHHGRRLKGCVKRRLLRVGKPGSGGVQLELSRSRPTAIEVYEAGLSPYRVPIGPAPEPAMQAARAVVIVALAAWLLPRLLAWARDTR